MDGIEEEIELENKSGKAVYEVDIDATAIAEKAVNRKVCRN